MNHMLQVALLGLLLLVGCSAFNADDDGMVKVVKEPDFNSTNVHNEPDERGGCQVRACLRRRRSRIGHHIVSLVQREIDTLLLQDLWCCGVNRGSPFDD